MAKRKSKSAPAPESAPVIGHNTELGGELKAFTERIERLHEERRALSQDISEIYKEAKERGLNPKTMRRVINRRGIPQAERQEQDDEFDIYWHAIHGGEPPLLELGKSKGESEPFARAPARAQEAAEDQAPASEPAEAEGSDADAEPSDEGAGLTTPAPSDEREPEPAAIDSGDAALHSGSGEGDEVAPEPGPEAPPVPEGEAKPLKLFGDDEDLLAIPDFLKRDPPGKDATNAG